MHVALEGDKVLVSIDPAAGELRLLSAIRSLPYREFDPKRNAWVVEHCTENHEQARRVGLDLDGVPEPTRSITGVDARGKSLVVTVPPTRANLDAMRGLPDHKSWNKTRNAWFVKPTRRNVQDLRSLFPDMSWTQSALDLVTTTEAPFVQDRSALDELVERATRDFRFGTTPFRHQLQAFALGRDAKAFAYLMEQGTGKTKVTLDNAAFLFVRGDIRAVLVVCPKSVKSTWEEEVEAHLPKYVRRRVHVWQSGRSSVVDVQKMRPAPDELVFLVMNIDAVNTAKGREAADLFLARWPAMMVVDESSKIKTPGAQRTKNVIKLGQRASYRRILTGTPVTQSPLDLFTQFKFLDANILGFSSFYAFRNHFTLMGGYENRQVLKYVNMSELTSTIKPYSFRVTKDECLDLPEKVYRKLTVDLTPTQRRVYDQLVEEMEAELEGVGKMTATLALTVLLRLQQVVGGFFPLTEDERRDGMAWKPIPGGNPKLDALLDDIEELGDRKVLVWARFRPEIDIIEEALERRFGAAAVASFHGGVRESERTARRQAFQDPRSGLHKMVLQTDTGGVGLTLTAADNAYYYSHTFSLEARLQSEARNHRSGSEVHAHVTYTDVLARATLDTKVHRVLRKKLSLANLITGDNWKEWI